MEARKERRKVDRSGIGTDEDKLRRLLRLNEMSVAGFLRSLNMDRSTFYKWKESGNFPQWAFLYLEQRIENKRLQAASCQKKLKGCICLNKDVGTMNADE